MKIICTHEERERLIEACEYSSDCDQCALCAVCRCKTGLPDDITIIVEE